MLKSGLSTFFVILATVMYEATIYQNLTQLSIRKSSVAFLLSDLTKLLELCYVEITSLHLVREHADYVDIMLTVDPQDLKHLIPTLRRFDYEVLSKHDEDNWEDKLQEHASYLDKYLSM
jgi:hypothetical protein